MNFGKLAIIGIVVTTLCFSIISYKQQLPELKFVGIDYWNHTADVIHIMVDVKTNEIYLQNPDGTNTHKWIRKDTGKVIMLGEELPVENGGN